LQIVKQRLLLYCMVIVSFMRATGRRCICLDPSLFARRRALVTDVARAFDKAKNDQV